MKKRINSRKIFAAVMALTMVIAGSACGSYESFANGDTALAGAAKSDSPSRSKKALNAERESPAMAAEYFDNGVMEEACDASWGDYDGAFDMNSEEYTHAPENNFVLTADEPTSTFSTDVDTASFTNVRRMIDSGWEIDPEAVRTEEFINYFKYAYDAPKPGSEDKLSITTEVSDCPWNEDSKMLLVGLQAQDIEVKDIDSNIVFLIDVSGSMYEDNKLPLVQQAFSMLAENMGADDRVSIVTYAGADEVVLEGERGSNYQAINNALNALQAGGATAGAAGINTAYEIAEKYFIEGGNNRVILATDGDLNVGVSSAEGLTKLIEEKREKGVFLSVLGFGMGNYKDDRLEALADNGNGNYAYIDTLDEARRILVTEMNGTLFTVAKDAKIQIEFDPATVSAYKLVGYENRVLANEDFENDAKDAGDVGAGQQVTALYEIVPAGHENRPNSNSKEPCSFDGLDGRLAKVSVRYKERDENESKLIESSAEVGSYKALDEASENIRLAAAAAMTAKGLRGGAKLSADDIAAIRKYTDGLSLDASELISMIDKLGV